MSRPTPSDAVSALVHRGRTWATVGKAGALFVLPLPLVIALLAALIGGDVVRFGLVSGALASIWSAGLLSWRALVAEARYTLGDRADLPRVPRKLLGALLTATGAAFAAGAAGHADAGIATFAALGAGGHLAFYGLDMRPRRISVAVVEGIDTAAVARQLEQAHGRLRRIEAAARVIRVPEFCDRLQRIIAIGRGILGEIERDPREASRARRFLHVYLDSTERVTEEFARTHPQVRSVPLEQSFRQLLIDMETSFAQQHRKLLEHDAMSLDVDIEVLSARLRREGLGEQVETRR